MREPRAVLYQKESIHLEAIHKDHERRQKYPKLAKMQRVKIS